MSCLAWSCSHAEVFLLRMLSELIWSEGLVDEAEGDLAVRVWVAIFGDSEVRRRRSSESCTLSVCELGIVADFCTVCLIEMILTWVGRLF